MFFTNIKAPERRQSGGKYENEDYRNSNDGDCNRYSGQCNAKLRNYFCKKNRNSNKNSNLLHRDSRQLQVCNVSV